MGKKSPLQESLSLSRDSSQGPSSLPSDSREALQLTGECHHTCLQHFWDMTLQINMNTEKMTGVLFQPLWTSAFAVVLGGRPAPRQPGQVAPAISPPGSLAVPCQLRGAPGVGCGGPLSPGAICIPPHFRQSRPHLAPLIQSARASSRPSVLCCDRLLGKLPSPLTGLCECSPGPLLSFPSFPPWLQPCLHPRPSDLGWLPLEGTPSTGPARTQMETQSRHPHPPRQSPRAVLMLTPRCRF